MKKCVKAIAVLLILAVMTGMSAYAALPNVLYPGYKGNSTGLFVITNPPKDKSATFDSSYIISGYGKSGVTVSVYTLRNGTYQKTNHQWTIGASGLFFNKVGLNKGANNLLLVAETPAGETQAAYLQITYLGSGGNVFGSGVGVNGLF